MVNIILYVLAFSNQITILYGVASPQILVKHPPTSASSDWLGRHRTLM